MSALVVVVLAAGQGKRMKSELPKVLHRIGHRTLLEFAVSAAEALGPKEIVVVHGHGGDLVRQTLHALSVTWVEQAEQKGTGHAVAQAERLLDDDANVLVLYGDVPLISSESLRKAVACADDNTLGLLTVHLEDPTGYGRIVRDSHGLVTGIVEHKDASAGEREIHEVNTGIMAVPGKVLKRWLRRLRADNAQGEYYLTDVVAMAVSEGWRVQTVSPADVFEVEGVNDRVQLARLERHYQLACAERLMLDGATVRDPSRLDIRGCVTLGRDVVIDINVVFEGEVVLGERARIGPNCVIRNSIIGDDVIVLPNCVIEDSRIGAGSQIGPFSRLRPETDLQRNVRIGNFVEVKNSRISDGSKVNHLSYVGDSDVGSGVNVGAGTITCNYDGANKHRTIIGDGAFIGSGTELVAPVKIGANATIGAGSTITKDALAGTLTLSRSKQTAIPGWRKPQKIKK